MNNPESQSIVQRFFDALHVLIVSKRIRGVQTFTRKYEIDRWNFLKLDADKSRNIFQVSWLARLVDDFGVSSDWLLLGKGTMFTDSTKQA